MESHHDCPDPKDVLSDDEDRRPCEIVVRRGGRIAVMAGQYFESHGRAR
jgi:hypothetical protein